MRRVDFKGFKIFHKDDAKPNEKVAWGGALVLFCEIGDLEGPSLPNNMRDTTCDTMGPCGIRPHHFLTR